MSDNVKELANTHMCCPICGSATCKILSLPFEYTKKKLEYICNAKLSPDVHYPDYDLLKCNNCTLEFAAPFIAPSNHFYLWLTTQSFPYVESRWEWNQAIHLLKEINRNRTESIRLADIGCGTGNFLKLVKQELMFDAIGIDHNHDAIQQCLNNGLSAYCGEVSHIENIFPQGAHVITLWHILEHVSSPIEVLEKLKSMLSNNGLILVSVPLSPMTAEALEFDYLNLPPHHLTRWNSKSLIALSEKLQMEASLYHPPQLNILHMLLKTLIFSSTQGKLKLSRWQKLCLLIKILVLNPISVTRSFRKLKSRQKEYPIHDIALLKLTKNGNGEK